jgi:hypothetical protein
VTYLDAGDNARSFEHLKWRVLPTLVRYMMKDDRELKVITETIVEQYFNQTNFGDQDQIVKAFSNVSKKKILKHQKCAAGSMNRVQCTIHIPRHLMQQYIASKFQEPCWDEPRKFNNTIKENKIKT